MTHARCDRCDRTVLHTYLVGGQRLCSACLPTDVLVAVAKKYEKRNR